VGVVIGAKHATKKLPIEKLATLCEKLPYPIILLGGPEDHAAGEEIRGHEPLKIFNGCGIYSLNQSASIVRQAKLIITHDTGLMHIAAAFRKQIISVWGNTVPQFGMYPYFGKKKSPSGDPKSMNDSQIVEVNKLACRPCSKIGFSKCPRRHFRCMRLIDEMEIIKLTQ
jgi:heptosyltransferase-2